MFVRIRKSDSEGVLYHASSIRFNSDVDEDEHTTHMTIETLQDKRRRVVDKTQEEVYIMNEQGQTVEAYRWEPLKDQNS